MHSNSMVEPTHLTHLTATLIWALLIILDKCPIKIGDFLRQVSSLPFDFVLL